jgi:hypothetical protein
MALAGAMGGWIDLRGQPSGCDRRGAGRVRSCSEGGICRRLRDVPDDHTLNLRQRRDAGWMMAFGAAQEFLVCWFSKPSRWWSWVT